MALTLVIVSFSCTGPILGTLLVGSLSEQGNAWQLTIGMGAFGLALALPFALFALFPQALKSLPKSGGWLDKVKKSLAFVELALAVKFLSNADLVEHWGILKREVFIGLWILIAAGLSAYLFGLFPQKQRTLTVVGPRRLVTPGFVFATLVLVFALYLIPGLTASKMANLKLLSGFAPPLNYSVYKKDKGASVEPQFVNDYEKARELSQQTGKPLLIDFTGWACVNCRKMEEQVWTRPPIESLINEKFILVSLYVDDREKLPADQQFSMEDKEIVTVGEKWAAFQNLNFKSASQPMYVALGPDGELLNHPVGFKKPDEYRKWLECALDASGQKIAKQ
jgi:thiol:disulfide interchange protein DsbD